MVAEERRAERVAFDCVEYLGFSLTEDHVATIGNAATINDALAVDPAKEVILEVYGHPDAQVRVYVRPHTPSLIIMSLLEKIATAIEVEQQIRPEVDASDQRLPRPGEAPGSASTERGSHCRRCRSALDERSFIRDLHGPLCISCGRDLQLL